MAKKRPPLEMDNLTENLKTSRGQGANAFFSSPAPQTQFEKIPEVEQSKDSPTYSVDQSTNQSSNQPSTKMVERVKRNEETTSNIASKQVKKHISNKSNNNKSNIVSNITILQITSADIDSLRELAEKPQTFRLTNKDIEYVKDQAYQLSKESKRGKIGQGDILRIGLLLFDKFISSNKAELKEILERIK